MNAAIKRVQTLGMPFFAIAALILVIALFPVVAVASFFLVEKKDRPSFKTLIGGTTLCMAFWAAVAFVAAPSSQSYSSAPSSPTYGYTAEEREFLQSQGVSPSEARAVETAICRQTEC